MDDELLLDEAAGAVFVTEDFRDGAGSRMGVRNGADAVFLFLDGPAAALDVPFTVGRTWTSRTMITSESEPEPYWYSPSSKVRSMTLFSTLCVAAILASRSASTPAPHDFWSFNLCSAA